MQLLYRPKLTKYMFGTRTSAVVFALLLSQTEKAEEVMSELLPTPNTRAWKKWKAVVLDWIKRREDFDCDGSGWNDGTWPDTDEALLIDPFQDCRDASQVFKGCR
ncbi:hypothetical protein EDC04DRAFT_2580356 [Pisolithus marmoratus]|nr:hypothetical protein EDC04DRAFT_2580356 [Pisolithus marmoratus]